MSIEPERKLSNINSQVALARVPSAEHFTRSKVDLSNSRSELKTAKSGYRIMSTTQQIQKNDTSQSMALFGNF